MSTSVDRAGLGETTSAEPAACLAFWESRLAGTTGGMALPVRATRPDPALTGLVALDRTLPVQVGDRLRAVGTAGPRAVLSAAVCAVLARYAVAEDVVVWVSLPMLAELAGLPVPDDGAAVLPLPVRYDGGRTIAAALDALREQARAVYRHRRVEPAVLPPRIDGDRAVRVAFATAAEVSRHELLAELGRADLVLTGDVDGPVRIGAHYRAGVLDGAAVTRLLASLEVMLAGAASSPDRAVADLPILPAADQARVVAQASGPSVRHPDRPLPHRWVADRAAATPDATAVACGTRSLTYRELDERANQLAHHLLARGVGRGSRVALCLERGPEMIVGMLAALRTGAAYLPVDPGYPDARLTFVLTDARPAVLLVDAASSARLPDPAPPVVRLDPDWTRFADQPSTPPEVDVTADDLAYVIYTSGSTGQPKGVELRHAGLLNLIHWHHAAYRLSTGDRTSQLAGTAFDASVWEIWPTLTAGATLCLTDAANQESAADLVRWLVEHRITVAFLPTALAELVLDEPWPRECVLRYLLTGGDTLHRYPPPGLPFVLVNHYGPTENTVVTTATEVPAGGDAAGREPSIGRPLPNTRVYVLDERRRPVPVGVIGELYIGGDGLARGYLNRSDLTTERFVPDPCDESGASRLYRTGDLGRWRADGQIDFLGRNDAQVKLRGFRLELGEIEAVLGGHPQVAEAAVLLREDSPGHRQLVGYLVPRANGGRPTGTELRRWLGFRLPGYMVPVAFVVLAALPVTRNGKVDRAALPAPDPVRATDLGNYLPPVDGVESSLAALWSELLGVRPVGVLDDFFALGGNSLAATQVVTRLRGAFGVDLPLSAVFAEPTVRGLGARIRQAQAGPDGPDGPGGPGGPGGSGQSNGSGEDADHPDGAIRTAARGQRQPLTAGQSALWLVNQLDPDGITCNVPLTIDLRGHLDAAALHRALTDIVARHESLRTRFEMVDGTPVQVVDEPPDVDLPVVRVPGSAAAQEWIVAESRRPFDVTRGPLVRFALLERGADDHVLLVVVHHIAFDGWSLGVFCRELGERYDVRMRDPATPPPPPPTVQCVDVARWQREALGPRQVADDLAYWRETLDGVVSTLDLPTDVTPPDRPGNAGARTVVTFDPVLSERLAAFSRAEGVTVFMTLLAAFQAVLSRYCGASEVVVGSPVAGRIRPEMEQLIGCFINTLPLRTDLSGDPSFRELLTRVRAVALGAYEHQAVAFDQIVEALAPERVPGQLPFYRVVFAIEDAHDAVFAFSGIRARVTEVDFGQARADFGVSITPVDGALRVCAEYRTELFTEATARRILESLRTLLDAALADPDQRVAVLPLLDARRRHQMVAEWNDTAADYPRDTCLHGLIEQRVDEAPDALAVVFEDEARLTYRELDERANRLAHHLRGLGVGASDRVAVHLHRSVDMVVALVAILKAGASYVPLDPVNPPDRLAFMMSDAGVPVVLTATGLRDQLPESTATVVELDGDWPEVAGQPATRPPAVAGPHDLAYVIYTSGSTGQPKGVMVEHHAVSNFVTAVHRLFEMGPHDDMLQFASLGFDVSVFEIFSALTIGARVHLARRETLLSPRELTRFMREHHISVMDMPPAVMSLLDGGGFPDLRIAFVGGEAFSGDVVNDWVRPGRRFFNGYGPTEATVTVIVEECEGTDWRTSPPIGVPMINMTTYVLDRNEELVPPGVPGELHLGGACVARGYLNQPALTARAFIPDPFAGDPNARLYKTGDLVKYLPDGRLVYLGRLDNQVKLRGHRIELGEIEVALRQHPRVRDAVALLREDGGERRLVAYAQSADGEPPQPTELRAHLARGLPPYMVPAAILVLDTFPLNPSGKVDRPRLPAPDEDLLAAGQQVVAPRNRRERTLVDIWARLLGEPNIGVHDNFFARGGHSLLGARLVWEVHQAFGVEISIRDVFERPTVAQLAELIEAEMLASLDREGSPR